MNVRSETNRPREVLFGNFSPAPLVRDDDVVSDEGVSIKSNG